MGKFSFRKEERLSREKWIDGLFKDGASFQLYPLRVLYMPHPDASHPVTQVLFSVSKRYFKRAIDRNKIKRRMREAYRLNKSVLDTTEKWLIAYIYVAKEILPSPVFQEKLPITLSKISAAKHEKK